MSYTPSGGTEMGWETRGSRKYYYRSDRINGRVVRTYVPAGLVDLAEMIAQSRHSARDEAAARRRNARQERNEVTARLDALDDWAETLLTAARLAAGFHNHKGQWRLRRDAQTPPETSPRGRKKSDVTAVIGPFAESAVTSPSPGPAADAPVLGRTHADVAPVAGPTAGFTAAKPPADLGPTDSHRRGRVITE